MATHQVDGLGMTSKSSGNTSSGNGHALEDEVVADVDEPPERRRRLRFSKCWDGLSHAPEPLVSPHSRKASLLTQALLTSPELTPLSDIDAPHLTSDGGLTSPARTMTPSPPSSANLYHNPPIFPSTLKVGDIALHPPEQILETPQLPHDPNEKTVIEETLGRKRCISFACGKKVQSPSTSFLPEKVPEQVPKGGNSQDLPQRRPCMLRFACPTKPMRSGSNAIILPMEQPHHAEAAPSPHVKDLAEAKDSNAQQTQFVEPQACFSRRTSHGSSLDGMSPKQPFNRVDFSKSEATRFHEFAGQYQNEDEWTHEQTAYRQKMTINDTLQKENAIRRLADEAEEEALEEEAASLGEDNDDSDEDTFDEREAYSKAFSDDGNESDDEGGFAESDDESDDGNQYQFWTPGVTTAATSTEHLEHIRPLTDRVASDSSIDSFSKARKANQRGYVSQQRQHPKVDKRPISQTKEQLAKVEDFIIGTLDEDRPSQDAYLSSLEERKRLKQKLIPQDIDPSFPTSDPEVDDDGNESEDEDSDLGTQESSEGEQVTQFVGARSEKVGPLKSPYRRTERPSAISPKRLHSPPPRRLFNHSNRLRSPPPPTKRIVSPPPSRRPSPQMGSPAALHFIIPHLAQRPNLTRTASLPRSGNPFWEQSRAHNAREHGGIAQNGTTADAELHTRGPVDIVQGLEHKRQRRREKYWRLHCQKAHAGKDRERKCQPGKGAQRMREVGITMQDRFRGYGHNRPNLMLSI